MAMQEWVRLPTAWIEGKGLRQLSWSNQRVDALTALMTLIVITQYADQDTGVAKVTYDQLHRATGLSRTTIAGGLGILEQTMIDRGRQSEYLLRDYNPAEGWAKLPAKSLYNGRGEITFFRELKRRKPIELDALKFYLLCVSRRNRDTNLAHLTFDRIEEYTGIARDKIKIVTSFLAANAMIYVEPLPRGRGLYGMSYAYRVPHVDTYNHMGTSAGQKLFGQDPSWLNATDDF